MDGLEWGFITFWGLFMSFSFWCFVMGFGQGGMDGAPHTHTLSCDTERDRGKDL